MAQLSSIYSRAFSYLSTIGITDIIDILIVAFIIYEVITIIRRTNSFNLAKGLFIFLIALWLAEILELNMISFILRKATELGFIALLILFQPELRRALEKVGSRFSTRSAEAIGETSSAISELVLACSDMSASRTGALIILERYVRLDDYISTGTVINSDVSAELLKNLFYNKAPLHDGAVIIRDGRIAAAGCVLPLTANRNISKDLGMRHRAGIGLSEQCDAVVLIVSEETGAISCAIDGSLKRHLKPQALERLLVKELRLGEERVAKVVSLPVRIFNRIFAPIRQNAEEAKDETNL